MKAIITVGIPASGKSTKYADFKGVIVNRDDARELLFGNYISGEYKFSSANEKKVTEYCWEKVLAAKELGWDVAITDTNLNKCRREALILSLEKIGYQVEVDVIECSYELAVKRDLKRERSVGSDVIWKFFKQWHQQFGVGEAQYIEGLQNCYIFDIDGTLAKMNGRSPFEWHRVGEDEVNESVTRLFGIIRDQGEKIFIFSGRDSVCREETWGWLRDKDLIDDVDILLSEDGYIGQVELFMRPEYSTEKDFYVKLQMFDEQVRGKYNVMGVFDDRPQVCRLWNLLGLPLFKVGD